MPNCGSQIYLCDLPIRFDTYKGCSHACKYCFASTKRDLKDIKIMETPSMLLNFIKGKRNQETNWCDWNIPLHWGGLSDPFQPCEKIHRVSLECLKIFKETQYPFIVSTKGALVADDEYLDLLSECNCVVQISLVCDKYDILEKGCPSFEERLAIVDKISKRVKRVIIRVQPYMHEVFEDVYNNLERFKNAGAYGVIIEGMKFKKKKEGLIKIGGDFVYPYDIILNDFVKLKEKAHKLGLKIYAGENRIRKYGDSLTCCGIDELKGFKPNVFNLNHILNGDKTRPTEKMMKLKTGGPFASFNQSAIGSRETRGDSFCNQLAKTYKKSKSKIDKIMGVVKDD